MDGAALIKDCIYGSQRIYRRNTSEQRISTCDAIKQSHSEAKRTVASMNSNLREQQVQTTSMPSTVTGLLQIVKVEVHEPSKRKQVKTFCDTGATIHGLPSD